MPDEQDRIEKLMAEWRADEAPPREQAAVLVAQLSRLELQHRLHGLGYSAATAAAATDVVHGVLTALVTGRPSRPQPAIR